jgi:hypothetical protein
MARIKFQQIGYDAEGEPQYGVVDIVPAHKCRSSKKDATTPRDSTEGPTPPHTSDK